MKKVSIAFKVEKVESFFRLPVICVADRSLQWLVKQTRCKRATEETRTHSHEERKFVETWNFRAIRTKEGKWMEMKWWSNPGNSKSSRSHRRRRKVERQRCWWWYACAERMEKMMMSLPVPRRRGQRTKVTSRWKCASCRSSKLACPDAQNSAQSWTRAHIPVPPEWSCDCPARFPLWRYCNEHVRK